MSFALLQTGITHHKAGQLQLAESIYRQVLDQNPDEPTALYMLGGVFLVSGREEETLELWQKALRVRPSADLHYDLANLYNRRGNQLEAQEHYRAAFELNPHHVGAAVELTALLLYRGSFEDVLSFCSTLADHVSGDVRLLNNKGLALIAEGRAEEAVELYRKMIVLQPDDVNLHANLTIALLVLGCFEEGFREYQWRWTVEPLKKIASTLWRGEDLRGKTLLILGEHGFGDAIQFSRYIPLLYEQGIHIIVRVPVELVQLFSVYEPYAQILSSKDPIPAFDRHASMVDLPAGLKTTVSTIPVSVPYIAVDPALSSRWRERLQQEGKSGAKRIGIVWRAERGAGIRDLEAKDRRRSIPIEKLAPLFEVPGCRFYSLQKKSPAIPADFGIIDYMADCDDFAETAALIEQLDLVISIDTSVLHLAGAMGKPVWLLNRYDTCWRWFKDREDSPWYPTLRVFRQKKSGEWETVVSDVARALHEFIK